VYEEEEPVMVERGIVKKWSKRAERLFSTYRRLVWRNVNHVSGGDN